MRVSLRSPLSVLLALPFLAGLTGCGSEGSPSARLVPEEHAAVHMHAMKSFDEAVAVARVQGMDFVCGTFSVPGRNDWERTSACMVSDRGIVSVIAFDDAGADWRFVVTGPAITGDVMVPVDDIDAYGIETAPSGLELSVQSGRAVIGTLSFGAS